MTLEDFLVKAGLVTLTESQQQQHPQWMQIQLPSVQQHNRVAVFMPGHSTQPLLPLLDAPYIDTQINLSSDTQMPGRKRIAPGDVTEKTVGKRQKRMIKNRESAARSRARKQAYTHELEIKISRLEEENERLRRQKEVEVLPCVPPPEPKCYLRRTNSAHF